MLVVKLYPRERVIIVLEDGRQITVVYLRHRGATIQLGVEAPRTIRVQRGEDRLAKEPPR